MILIVFNINKLKESWACVKTHRLPKVREIFVLALLLALRICSLKHAIESSLEGPESDCMYLKIPQVRTLIAQLQEMTHARHSLGFQIDEDDFHDLFPRRRDPNLILNFNDMVVVLAIITVHIVSPLRLNLIIKKLRPSWLICSMFVYPGLRYFTRFKSHTDARPLKQSAAIIRHVNSLLSSLPQETPFNAARFGKMCEDSKTGFDEALRNVFTGVSCRDLKKQWSWGRTPKWSRPSCWLSTPSTTSTKMGMAA
jgi:hypothetical protein